MNDPRLEDTIGYSGFEKFEECYEYFENACYIADTPEAAAQLMEDSGACIGEYRIDPITLAQILDNYGCSCGEYAMQPEAFARFTAIAKLKGVRFEA